ncbi:MAG: aminotransferase class V-fold PLP-dependent enzyme [Candidatus Nanohaloarchaea archaeon]|nr:aminotransferase class V-fold PLP-dependent enzyme [Candidatus Nanohaloarchaea archaeon]
MREDDFPDLDTVYLDSACMSLRPEQVIASVKQYYDEYPVCPGRGNYQLSKKATQELENARSQIADFISADTEDVMLTSGTTESINTVAASFPADKVILSDREHNSNLIPWQEHGYDIDIVETGDEFIPQLASSVQEGDLVSLVHVSNLDGYEIPVKEASEIVRENGAYLLLDAAQSIPHHPFSVKETEPDFVAFSGHKMCGPSGTGGLYASERVKDMIDPLMTGGGSVTDSTFTSHDEKAYPHGMESGLPNIAGLIGMGSAARYLDSIGMETIRSHEETLSQQLYEEISDIDSVRNVGSTNPGVISLRIGSLDPNQAAIMLDQRDIAVRSGMHCVHSWFHHHGKDPTIRVSLHLYNNSDDITELIAALKEISVLG